MFQTTTNDNFCTRGENDVLYYYHSLGIKCCMLFEWIEIADGLFRIKKGPIN